MKKLCMFLVLGVFLALMATAGEVEYPEGMVSYWKFDEGFGFTVLDSVGENTGSIYGATWMSEGKVGGAMSFNNTHIKIPDHESLNPEFMTLEAWIYVDKLYSTYNSAIGKQSSYPYPWHLYMFAFSSDVSDNHPEFWVEAEVGRWRVLAEERIQLDVWTHWVGTYDEEFARLYLNGELVAELLTSGAPIPRILGTPLYLGRFVGAGNHNFYGMIDEVALYNRALTAEEIQQHYQNGLVGLGYAQTHFSFNCVTEEGEGLGSNEILVPLDGLGMLGFKAGSTFKVLDNDMTDGQAWVQIPAGLYDTFDQVRGKPGGELFWGNAHARGKGKPEWEQHNDPLDWRTRLSGNWSFTNDGIVCYSFRLYPK